MTSPGDASGDGDGTWDSSLVRDLPVTSRGLRTREALVSAARIVFEREGYLDSRLVDITTQAACAAGTFYTYFASREEIFAAVLEKAKHDMMQPGLPVVDGQVDPYASLEAANRAYLIAYRRNAKLMGLLEQAAHVDPRFAVYRRQRADAFVRRNARGIRSLQDAGLAARDLDPTLTSRALSGMVSSIAYSVFVIGDIHNDVDEPVSLDELVDTLTRLWVNALRLPHQVRSAGLDPESA